MVYNMLSGIGLYAQKYILGANRKGKEGKK